MRGFLIAGHRQAGAGLFHRSYASGMALEKKGNITKEACDLVAQLPG